MGTAEWVMVGLLPQLSADWHRPLPAVGYLVTWYALVITVAGPLFVAGNLAAVLAGSFNILVAARMLTALTHSTAFAAAMDGRLESGHGPRRTAGHLDR